MSLFKIVFPEAWPRAKAWPATRPGAGIGTLNRCSRTWARRKSCQRNHFLATAKNTPSTTADYPGACASETEQLDYLRDRSTHRSGASQRRLLGEAHRRWSTEFSGAPCQRSDTPFQVRNSVEKRVCRSAKEESKPRFPSDSASRIRDHFTALLLHCFVSA